VRKCPIRRGRGLPGPCGQRDSKLAVISSLSWSPFPPSASPASSFVLARSSSHVRPHPAPVRGVRPFLAHHLVKRLRCGICCRCEVVMVVIVPIRQRRCHPVQRLTSSPINPTTAVVRHRKLKPPPILPLHACIHPSPSPNTSDSKMPPRQFAQRNASRAPQYAKLPPSSGHGLVSTSLVDRHPISTALRETRTYALLRGRSCGRVRWASRQAFFWCVLQGPVPNQNAWEPYTKVDSCTLSRVSYLQIILVFEYSYDRIHIDWCKWLTVV